jgi:hypothetical protein
MVMYPIVRTNSLSTSVLTIESHKQVIVEISIINPLLSCVTIQW